MSKVNELLCAAFDSTDGGAVEVVVGGAATCSNAVQFIQMSLVHRTFFRVVVADAVMQALLTCRTHGLAVANNHL